MDEILMIDPAKIFDVEFIRVPEQRDKLQELFDSVGEFEIAPGREMWQSELYVAADRVADAEQWVRDNVQLFYEVKVKAKR